MDANPNRPFRNPGLFRNLAARTFQKVFAKAETIGRPLRFMEVCGSHTAAISRLGIRGELRNALELVAGPGCPVCVTDQGEIEAMIRLSREPGVLLATFGDLMRVPGRHGSLAEARTTGADVRVVYSPADAVLLAEENPDRLVVFLGVGFETTAPVVAAALERAQRAYLVNFTIFPSHKLTPPAVAALLRDGASHIDGLILPGHVSTVIGRAGWRFLEAGGPPAVIAGFEPLDILAAIHRLVEMDNGQLFNQYDRVVPEDGNPTALALLDKYFERSEAPWRGLGIIPESGLRLREKWRHLSAPHRLGLEITPAAGPPGCRCGDVLKGVIPPSACPLFGGRCTPERPVGPCMVSAEGACGIYHRYEGGVRDEQRAHSSHAR